MIPRFIEYRGRMFNSGDTDTVFVTEWVTLLEGAGIAWTPTFVVGKDIREGRLIPILRAFVDFMAQRITETPYWDV